MGWFLNAEGIWRISVGVAAVSFFTMAGAGAYFLNARRDFEFRLLAWLYVFSLVGNGISRAMLAWEPRADLGQGLAATAFVNALFALAMAIVTVWVTPAALRMPSPRTLGNMNATLRVEIDQRKAVEGQLRHLIGNERLAGEAKIRSYFEAASQAIIAVSSDGRIVLVNRRTEEMFGYSRIELLGQELEILLPDRYRSGHVANRRDYFAEPRMRSMGAGMELAGRRKDGTEFPVEIGLSYVESDDGVLALGLVSDITERRRAADALSRSNAELREREAHLQSYLEAASQSIIAISEQGRIILVNRRTEDLFGYSREEMLGQELEMLVPERHRGRHVHQRQDFFDHPRVRPMGAPGMELVARRRDGTEFPVEIGLSYVQTDKGNLSMALISDVTERKRAADELARVSSELRRSNAELEQFAYLASHDLQEPLRMVTSYLTLLERRYHSQLDPEAREFIGYAVEGATRMKNLIRDVLKFSRVGAQALHAQKVVVEDVVQHALDNLKLAIEERGAEVAMTPFPPIVADAGMLTQVFQNLIGNAVKFSKGRPVVRISAEQGARESIFSVSDNGIGIDPNHLERIFRIFERLNAADQYPGTGVGLAISKKIVELHGGRMWVESSPGEGSVFHFSIPLEPVSVALEHNAAKA